MAIKKNKNLSRRFLEELWNQKNVSIIDELLADTYVDHTPPLESSHEGPQGREAIKQIFEEFHLDFSEVHVSIVEQIASEEMVTTLVTWECTPKNSAPPVTVMGVGIDSISNGQIVENWNTFDVLYRLLNLQRMLPPIDNPVTLDKPFRPPGPKPPHADCSPDKPCAPGFMCRYDKCWRA